MLEFYTRNHWTDIFKNRNDIWTAWSENKYKTANSSTVKDNYSKESQSPAGGRNDKGNH